VEELGARPAPGAVYVDTLKPVDLICASGHLCQPRPGGVLQGKGICRTCAGRDPAAAEAAFWAAVERLGARAAPGATYVTARTPVDLICAAGHPCSSTPNKVQQGSGICRTCAGQDPAVAEAAFWARVEALGGTPAPGVIYVNSRTPVQVMCAAGHSCAARPGNVQQGRGICITCAGQDPVVGAAAFWAAIEALGAQPADGAIYVNNGTRVALICVAGHSCEPFPGNVTRGVGICRTCAGLDPAVAEAAFWSRVEELGARPAPGAVYVNAVTRVPLNCAAGHPFAPKPADLTRGRGICRPCAGRPPYDRVYLLLHHEAAAVKVGVASGECRVREHARRGYRLLAEWTGLEHDDAVVVECAVLSSWRAAGIEPVLAAPVDGWTETAPYGQVAPTYAQLVRLLGPHSRGEIYVQVDEVPTLS
jgi:hypothetical protein